MESNTAARDVEILGLTSDSREVRPGYLFAAIKGSRADGGDYIIDALGRGAAAVLGPPGTLVPEAAIEPGSRPVPVITDDNPRRRLALMAARFFGPQPATIAAVTGTNGKTSVVSFLRQIWSRLDRRAASLGTLGLDAPDIDIAGVTDPGALTTPDPVALHRCIADLEQRGVDRLALEASSHGLDQYRLDGVRVTAAAFTNISRDHLDYHGTKEAYLAAKVRLFDTILAPGGTAVLNADIPEFGPLKERCEARGHRIIGFGRNGEDVKLTGLDPLADGLKLDLEIAGKRFAARLGLVGDFQAMNAVCALALAIATGEDAEASLGALAGLEGVPGRMELAARHPNGAAIYVDYAHTPDALAQVLGALRAHLAGRLGVVCGCGGDRDPGKRPEMGRIATELADLVVVTDDNPRGEDAAGIRRQILDAAPGAREIGDRAQAIIEAIGILEPDDILVVAGKGHESGQIVGGETIPFDDRDQVRSAVAGIVGAS
ncbi:MAG: UDP-N-acetylmuramoyl-L-alanyl-D-glutamate--2,6-diaminopimelate ligase [Alphaproteobacteria bacterium]|nr:UDP-N-acetylmuramoyl-L-alanyl-D-glutamate--2,6-diaminopimelate ligase [Alphaproteobacteria bacterium]